MILLDFKTKNQEKSILGAAAMFKVLLSKFCGLLYEDTDKSRLTVSKFFYGHFRTSFSSLRAPLWYRVLLFRLLPGSRVLVFWFL